MEIKTKLTLTTAMSVEKDLEKEDKDLSVLLGAHSTEQASLEHTDKENDTESDDENKSPGSTKLAT